VSFQHCALLKPTARLCLHRYYGTSELVLLDVRDEGSEGSSIGPPRMYTE
jgi:hypothetical protein